MEKLKRQQSGKGAQGKEKKEMGFKKYMKIEKYEGTEVKGVKK